MRVVCDVFSISLPRHWRQLPSAPHCLCIGSECPLDAYFSFSWEKFCSPLSIVAITKMLIDGTFLVGSARKLNATVVMIDRGRLKYAYCDTRRKNRFFRSWRFHNGEHLVYVNYSSKWHEHEAGVAEAEQVVKSLRFLPIPVEI